MRLKDLDAVKEAALLCGLEFRENQRTFKWYGTFVGDTTPPAGRDPKDYGKCEHALRQTDMQGGYEVGLVPALDGEGYDALFDSWSSQGGRLPGKMAALKREYAAAVATKKAVATLARKGFSKVTRENLPGNRIRLRLRKR
jgi:hypothetical protein